MDDGIRNAWMNETPESMISSSFDHSSSSWMLSCSGFPWIFQKGGTDIGTPFKTSTDYSKYCFNRWSKMESFYTNFSVKHWWGSEGAEVSGQYLKGRHGVNSSAETFFCHIRSFVRSFIVILIHRSSFLVLHLHIHLRPSPPKLLHFWLKEAASAHVTSASRIRL